MSDEININLSLDVEKDNLRVSFRPSAITPDLTNELTSVLVQNINTSAYETIAFNSEVVAGGWYWFQNLTTNTSQSIKIASSVATNPATTYPFCELKAGEYALGRAVTTNFSAISITATANLQCGLLSL